MEGFSWKNSETWFPYKHVLAFLSKEHYTVNYATALWNVLWATMSHYEPLWPTMSHYDEASWVTMSHYYEASWVTMSHYEPRWAPITYYDPLWVTMSHYDQLWATMSHYDTLRATRNHYYPPTLSTRHQGVNRKNDDISLNIDFSLSVLTFYEEKWTCLTRWHYYFQKDWHLSFFVIILSFFGQKWKCFNLKIWHND